MKRKASFFSSAFLLCFLPIFSFAQYKDVSLAAGVANYGRNSGVAFGDYNADGLDDLYISVRDGQNKLYQNLGRGQFLDVGAPAGVDYGEGSRLAAWGDLNNDGYPELYLANYDRPDVLYQNNGDGTFTDVSLQARIYNVANPFSVSLADINADSWLDIYVANFKSENRLFLNKGDGTFSDYTYLSGALDTQNAMGTVFFDFDNDRDLDLYLVHDGQPNLFYENIGEGRFEDVSLRAGVDDAGSGMGVDAGDVNNDGWLDLYITNLYENVLYLNNGDGTFTNIAKNAGVDDYGMGWGTNFLDYNNDGLLDIYVANDSYFSPYPNVLYQNKGDLTFEMVQAEDPISSWQGAYGSACADIDLDGRVDIAIANTGSNDYAQLFKNENSVGAWIGFRLEGKESNRDAVGARIEIWDEFGIKRIKEVASGTGYAAQNSLMQHFGMGTAVHIDSLRIFWPSGFQQTIKKLDAGFYYHIPEGEAPVPIDRSITSSNQLLTELNARLQAVYPNPSNSVFEIELKIEQADRYRLSILDLYGREIRRLHQGRFSSGERRLQWDGRNESGVLMPAGSYFIALTSAKRQVLKLIMLTK